MYVKAHKWCFFFIQCTITIQIMSLKNYLYIIFLFLDASIRGSVRPSDRNAFFSSMIRLWDQMVGKDMGDKSECSKLIGGSFELSQNVSKCPKMSQNMPKFQLISPFHLTPKYFWDRILGVSLCLFLPNMLNVKCHMSPIWVRFEPHLLWPQKQTPTQTPTNVNISF